VNAYSYAHLATADKHRAIVAVVRIGTLERTAVFHKYDYSGTWVCSANPGYKADQIQAWTYEDELIQDLKRCRFREQFADDLAGSSE